MFVSLPERARPGCRPNLSSCRPNNAYAVDSRNPSSCLSCGIFCGKSEIVPDCPMISMSMANILVPPFFHCLFRLLGYPLGNAAINAIVVGRPVNPEVNLVRVAVHRKLDFDAGAVLSHLVLAYY